MLQPSAFQAAIYDHVRAMSDSLVIEATAGAGKTTVLVEIARLLPADIDAVFLAFNRHTAAQLKDKLPTPTRSRTVHSLGFATLARRAGSLPQPDRRKYSALVKEAVGRLLRDSFHDEYDGAVRYLSGLVHFAKVRFIDPGSFQQIADLADRYALLPPGDAGLQGALHAQLPKVLSKGVSLAVAGTSLDYTDMLYAPLVAGLTPPHFDFVAVDEAQDLNPLQVEFILKLARPSGRYVFVGDPFQAIYSFAGASQDVMSSLVSRTSAATLPLSVSYRCPRRHVQLARSISPDIRAAPDAPEGSITFLGDGDLLGRLRAKDLVLCRTNAPLFRLALDLLKVGKPAVMLGRDVAAQIEQILDNALGGSLAGWGQRLDAFEQVEGERIARRIRDPYASKRALHQLSDLVACARHLVLAAERAGATAKDAAVAYMRRLFEGRHGVITLATVHRAKGKEAARVFILYPDLMPASFARTPEDRAAEDFVRFVALTRAKHSLFFVTSEGEAAGWWCQSQPRQGAPTEGQKQRGDASTGRQVGLG